MKSKNIIWKRAFLLLAVVVVLCGISGLAYDTFHRQVRSAI